MNSFPSGHAIIFGALATSLYFIHKKLGITYLILAIVIGFSRVVAGVHFPVDIAFGLLLGILISIIFKLCTKSHWPRI